MSGTQEVGGLDLPYHCTAVMAEGRVAGQGGRMAKERPAEVGRS